MQLVAVQLEPIACDEVQPAIGIGVQAVANRINILVYLADIGEQHTGLLEQLSNGCRIKIETVASYAEMPVGL